MSKPARIADQTSALTSPGAIALRHLTVCGGLGGLRRVFAPSTVIGAERIADIDLPCVIAANHHSHADSDVLLTALPARVRRRLIVAAAADVWFPNRVAGMLSSVCLGAIPIDRTKVSRQTLELCNDLLADGWSLLIYPEGRRSPPDELGEFKPGAAWVARRAGVPIVPVHLEGTAEVLPKEAWVPRRHRVTVRIGEPIPTSPDDDARELNHQLLSSVATLGGHTVPAPRGRRRQQAKRVPVLQSTTNERSA